MSESGLSALLRPSIHWLFLFAPAALALEEAGAPAPLVFFAAALAIVPAAHLIVGATEQIAARTGDAIGGLLNATFGNAPELIIAVVALRSGLLDMVRASIIGAVLANLLLALGLALFLGGLRLRDQAYNAARRARVQLDDAARRDQPDRAELVRAVLRGGGVPAARSRAQPSLAVLLLGAYALYLVFSLRTHPESFASERPEARSSRARTRLGHAARGGDAPRRVALAAWMSELLVGAAADTGEALGMSQAFIGMVIVAIVGGAAEMLVRAQRGAPRTGSI